MMSGVDREREKGGSQAKQSRAMLLLLSIA